MGEGWGGDKIDRCDSQLWKPPCRRIDSLSGNSNSELLRVSVCAEGKSCHMYMLDLTLLTSFVGVVIFRFTTAIYISQYREQSSRFSVMAMSHQQRHMSHGSNRKNVKQFLSIV